MPVFAQHDYITTALESSKHVLSERPIIKAKDETLVTWYYSWCPVTWCVAENFRHWESVDYALSKLEQLGEIRHCGIHLNLDVGPGSPYWKYFGAFAFPSLTHPDVDPVVLIFFPRSRNASEPCSASRKIPTGRWGAFCGGRPDPPARQKY